MASTFSASELSAFERKSLKKPDGFVSSISNLFSKLVGHTQGLLFLLGGLIAVGVAIGFYLNHRDSVSHRANDGLYLSEKAFETEMKGLATQAAAQAQAEKTKNSKAKAPAQQPPSDLSAELAALEFKKLDVDTQLPDTVKKLNIVAQEFSGTRAALEAQLRLGGLYYRHGDASKAASWYEKAVRSASGNFEKATALMLLGNAYENLGKPTEALQSFQKALNLGEGSLKGDLLLGIARNHEALHDSAKARSTYDQILSELPSTDYAKSAEIFKSQL